MNTELYKDIDSLTEDLENRDREFEVLNSVIGYLENRDDEEDPSPEFRKQEDYGFISDVIVLLFPLHPSLGRLLPDSDKWRNALSKYLRDKFDFPQDYWDYSQETCLNNLKAFRKEKQTQYQDIQRKREKLKVKNRSEI